jgi:hypothetical protein
MIIIITIVIISLIITTATTITSSGFVFIYDDAGPGLKFDLGLMAEVEESRQTVSLMPEYLVVCCWRSIKEVSLLLGRLSLGVPITQPGKTQGLLTLAQVRVFIISFSCSNFTSFLFFFFFHKSVFRSSALKTC